MKYQVYPKEVHGISLEQIDSDALYVLEQLRAAGFVAFLVGGSVRDLVLKKTPKDFDISTSAKPEEIKQVFRNALLIGRRFRLAHVRFGKKIFEVSTFRSGDNDTDALILRDNTWGTPEEDVLRRDFTMNGLFYDSEQEVIIDYVDGYPDIRNKYLRTVGHPFLRFRQDPVRMLRLLKFQARFGFAIDPDVHVALLECRAEIMKSSPARVLEELLRMLESGASRPFFRLLIEHGLLQLMLPSLGSFLESPDGAEVGALLEAVDAIIREGALPRPQRSVLLACLVYPLLQRCVQEHFIERERTPTLTDVQELTQALLDALFSPFLLLTRRLKTSMVSLLTSQYRLTPIEKRRTKPRLPGDPEFPLAVDFLHLRHDVEPGLAQIYEEWRARVEIPPFALREEDLPDTRTHHRSRRRRKRR